MIVAHSTKKYHVRNWFTVVYSLAPIVRARIWSTAALARPGTRCAFGRWSHLLDLETRVRVWSMVVPTHQVCAWSMVALARPRNRGCALGRPKPTGVRLVDGCACSTKTAGVRLVDGHTCSTKPPRCALGQRLLDEISIGKVDELNRKIGMCHIRSLDERASY